MYRNYENLYANVQQIFYLYLRPGNYAGVFKIDQLRGEIPACIRVVYDHDLYKKNLIYFLMKEKSFQPLNYYENDTMDAFKHFE